MLAKRLHAAKSHVERASSFRSPDIRSHSLLKLFSRWRPAMLARPGGRLRFEG